MMKVLNPFTMIRNTIKLKRLNKMVRELCSGRTCADCPANIHGQSLSGSGCALIATTDLALDQWGLKEEETDDRSNTTGS